VSGVKKGQEMTDFDNLPSDEEGLAAIVVSSESDTLRAEALRRLRPTIESWARIVATPLQISKQRRLDLVDDSWAQIASRIDRYDPAREVKFSTWCWAVLRNYFFDRIQQQYRDALTRPGMSSIPNGPNSSDSPAVSEPALSDDFVSSLDAAIDVASQFGETDICTIETWGLTDRLLLLTPSALWPKVPNRRWNEWADAAGLLTPFPTTSYGNAETDLAVVDMLAHDLGEKQGTLRQRWYRKKHLLGSLRFVKELLEKESSK